MTRPPKPPAGRKPATTPPRRAGQGELPLDGAAPEEIPPKRPAKASGPARAAGKKAAAAKLGGTPAKPKHARAAKSATPPASKTAAPRHGPTGFGGWLWLLVIGQLLVTARMIDTLAKMAATIGTPLWQDHPGLVIADLGLYGFALALQLAVLAALALRKRLFVPLFIASIVAYFLIGRIEPLLAIAVLGMDPAGLLSRPVVTSMLLELAVGLVWGAYVLRSRRVKNTFVR